MEEELEDRTNPILALEEQLIRQKGILANSKLVQKLPDNGAKLKDTITKAEAALEKLKIDIATKQKHNKSLREVESLEWSPKIGGTHPGSSKSTNCSILDNNSTEDSNNSVPNLLKIIATSQISQRQPKQIEVEPNPMPVCDIDSSLLSLDEIETDGYIVKLIEKDAKISEQKSARFVPSKGKSKSLTSKSKDAENPSVSIDTNFTGSASSQLVQKKGLKQWDESLLPPNHTFEAVKLLSMEETVKISCEKYKQILQTSAVPKKEYAFDRLKKEGTLGSLSSDPFASRPVKQDVDDDEMSDLSEDEITEDSESENEGNNENHITRNLASLVNACLKLS